MDSEEVQEIEENNLQNAEVEDEEMEAPAGNPLFLNAVYEGNGLPEELVDSFLNIFPKEEREEEQVTVPMVLTAIKGKALPYFLCGYGFKPFELAREVLNAHESRVNWFLQFSIGCQQAPTLECDSKDEFILKSMLDRVNKDTILAQSAKMRLTGCFSVAKPVLFTLPLK